MGDLPIIKKFFKKEKTFRNSKKVRKGGMTVEFATEFTKDLTNEEKNNLLELYKIIRKKLTKLQKKF